MAALLTSQTTDTVTAGTAVTSTCCWLEIPNSSVFDGAQIVIQASSTDVSGSYSPLNSPTGSLFQPGWTSFSVPSGTYVRVIQARSGPLTSITVNVFPA